MSTAIERLPLTEARALAEEVVALLSPVCIRVEIAGSVRRQAETCGDLEICAIPKVVVREVDICVGLFDSQRRNTLVNCLDERCIELLRDGTFGYRLDVNGRRAVGAKYKRLSYRGFGLDLFSVVPGTEQQWGVIFTIRTGPSDFSHRLVTPRRQGGLLPDWLQVRDGALRHRTTGEVIPTPEEIDFLNAIDYGWLEPWARR